MKKCSKIWKISHYGQNIPYDNCTISSMGCILTNCQFIYDSELDCVLDIATEPENFGLKVYKHQERVDCVRNPDGMKYALFHPQPFCSIISSRFFSEETYLDGKVPEFYKISDSPDPWSTSFSQTVYHWIDVFMQ